MFHSHTFYNEVHCSVTNVHIYIALMKHGVIIKYSILHNKLAFTFIIYILYINKAVVLCILQLLQHVYKYFKPEF